MVPSNEKQMSKYTILHGNVVYKVENVTSYMTTDTNRVFKKGTTTVLSVPLSSVLVKDEEGVTARIVGNLITGTGINPPDSKTTVVQSDDTFAEGVVVGAVAGAILF